MHTIALKRGPAGFAETVAIDGRVLNPARSLDYVRHSPDGFEWGYGGSGPSQLAFAILLELTDDPEFAQANYMTFKWQFVAAWSRDVELVEIDLERWVAAHGGSVAQRFAKAAG